MAEPRIVAAVGIAAQSLDPSHDELAEAVEEAMAQAVTNCLAAGVSIEDSDTIRTAMQDARQRVRAAAGLPDDSA